MDPGSDDTTAGREPDLLPSTFEERGVPLAFAAAELGRPRVRPDGRGGVELLVRGWSGGRSVFVFPWAAVPGLIRLSHADRTLHAEIAGLEFPTPGSIQLAAARVTLMVRDSGAAHAAARRIVERDAGDRLATRYALMSKVIEATGVETDRVTLALLNLDSPEGRRLIQAAFQRLGSWMHATPEACYDQVLRVGAVLQPAGFAEEAWQGRLRRRLARVEALHGDAAAGRFGAMAPLVERTALLTVERCRPLVEAVDRELADLPWLIAALDQRLPALREAIVRLSWLLDGWEAAVEPLRDRDAMAGLIAALPVVPRQECLRRQDKAERDARPCFGRRVRPCEDWRTGEVDREMARRLGYAEPGPAHRRGAARADGPAGDPVFPLFGDQATG